MPEDKSENKPAKYDLEFFWDPVCPFAWVTSRWVEKVAKIKNMSVDWRFISLLAINADKDYEKDFPKGYPVIHGKGKQLLRVAAAVRKEHGRDAMGSLYKAMGETIWDRPRTEESKKASKRVGEDSFTDIATPEHIAAVLEKSELTGSFAEFLNDESLDAELEEEGSEALSRTGKDVGTPIITYNPPDGPSFFGPVISEVPESDEEAVRLFDAVLEIAAWPGFAEIKRSMRTWPKLKLLQDTDL